MQLSFIFTIDLRNREFEYFQYVNGLLDEETWLSYRQVILINHSSDRGRAWWDKVGRGIVDPEFGRLVDELLKNAEPDDTYERMSTWAGGFSSQRSGTRFSSKATMTVPTTMHCAWTRQNTAS